jgi:hypothetical protein
VTGSDFKEAMMETMMPPHQNQPHYAPASVGALMDPAVLRGAVIDANGDRRRAERTSPLTLQARWRVAMHADAAVYRRH